MLLIVFAFYSCIGVIRRIRRLGNARLRAASAHLLLGDIGIAIAVSTSL